MVTINLRRGVTRMCIVASALWLLFSIFMVGNQAYRSAEGLWKARGVSRPEVDRAKWPRVYSERPASDAGVVAVNMPDGQTVWVEVAEKDAQWSALYANLKSRAMDNFRTLAFVALIPLAFLWAAFYAALWIARGFKP